MAELTNAERAAVEALPYRLAAEAVNIAVNGRVRLSEIRLREGRPLTVTSDGKNYYSRAVLCTAEDISMTLRKLCGNSLYSHADTIREGYISYVHGIRAGLCGKAVVRDGGIDAVTDITSVNIRIPHRVRGAADGIYRLLERRGFTDSLLVYSPPGVGKTTVLRELAEKLATGASAHNVAVVDSRCELAAGLDGTAAVDVLSSYPRGRGIEIAVRTLSPDYVMCDEICTDEDMAALRHAVGSGVRIIASAHGRSYAELGARDGLAQLMKNGVFSVSAGLLERQGRGYKTEITFTEDVREAEAQGACVL